GLTYGKTYDCLITASNAPFGAGAPGTSGTFVLVIPPSAPQSVKAVPQPTTSATGSLKVTISPPAITNGFHVLSYTVTCTSTNRGVKKYNLGVASPIVVAGLTTGKKYTCAATAANKGGNSPSGVSNAVIVGAPDSPTGVSAARLAAGQIQV